MIVRDEKNEDFSVQFFFAFHRFKEFDKNFDGDNHVVRVLAIDNVENDDAAFHFAGEEKKIHSINCRV